MNARTFGCAAVVAAALLASAAPATGDAVSSVDLQIRGKAGVDGTLRPAYDRECFVCDLPAGTELSAKLKGFGLAASSFDLGLLLDQDAVPDVNVVRKGSTIGFKGHVVAATGRYRVTVTGSIDGDYDLAVAWKSSSKFGAAGSVLAAGATDSYAFSAPAGAVATIDVRPAKGSAFVTEILTVTGPGGYDAGPSEGTRRVLAPFAQTGDYAVSFRNAGAADGAWTVGIKLKLPKVKPAKVDIRDRSTNGAFAGDHTVFGRELGPEGGTLDLPATPGELNGSSITIPAGVLGGPVVVTIGVAAPVDPGDGLHTAGPAVEFGPSGTVFDPTGSDPSKQATLTIPFDPEAFPSGTDSLVIYVRTEDGEVSAVPRPYIFDGNTVSFTTSHLSAYQVATADPRPMKGEFVAVEFIGEQNFNFGGVHGFAAESLYVSGGTGGLDTYESRLTYSNEGVMGASSFLSIATGFVQFDVTVADDAHVLFQEVSSPDPPVVFRRGVSDDVLVAEDEPIVLLRRAAGAPTVATIAGRWHLFHTSFSTRQEGTSLPRPLFLELAGDAGPVTLGTDGTVTFGALRSVEASSEYPTGTWTSKTPQDGPPQGMTWYIGETDVSLMPPDTDEPIRLQPVLGGDVLVGRAARFPGESGNGPQAELFVLVRVSAGAKLSALAGDYAVVGNETEVVDETPTGQGLRFVVQTLAANIAGNGDVTIEGRRIATEHDGQGDPVTELAPRPTQPAGRFVVKSDGSFTASEGATGAFTPRGDFLVHTVFDGEGFAILFGTPGLVPVQIPIPKK